MDELERSVVIQMEDALFQLIMILMTSLESFSEGGNLGACQWEAQRSHVRRLCCHPPCASVLGKRPVWGNAASWTSLKSSVWNSTDHLKLQCPFSFRKAHTHTRWICSGGKAGHKDLFHASKQF